MLGLDPAPLVVCGFGLAASGVGAAHAFAERRPARAVLVGAAGSYDPIHAPVGSALVVGSVRCVGIGAGGQGAVELGFARDDAIVLGEGPALLSVATAAADPSEAKARAGLHPGVVAEEMEGYAVALAADRFGVELTIVRGISNLAGDRDHGRWQMAEALATAGALVDTIPTD